MPASAGLVTLLLSFASPRLGIYFLDTGALAKHYLKRLDSHAPAFAAKEDVAPPEDREETSPQVNSMADLEPMRFRECENRRGELQAIGPTSNALHEKLRNGDINVYPELVCR